MAAVERGREVGRVGGGGVDTEWIQETSEKVDLVVQVRDDGNYGLGWRQRRWRGKINKTW